MQKLVKISALVLSVFPFLAFAQESVRTGYIDSILRAASSILDQLVVILIALAVVWFIWNVIKFTMSEDDDGKSKARTQMIWGVIAIAVIVSVWGLVGLLQNISNINSEGVDTSTIKDLTPKLNR